MSMWRNWQTRCLQMADVGGSNPLMGTISGCGAIGSARDLKCHGVAGSSPVIPTVCIRAATGRRGRLKPDLFEGSNPSGCIECNMVSVAKLIDAADCGSAGRNPM